MSLSALIMSLAGVVAPTGEAPPPRYGEPPAAAATFDAFTAAPPTTAGNPPAADWNAQNPAVNPLPPQAVAVPVASQWNDGQAYVADAAAAAAADPIQRLGAELQNAAAPIQEGVDRLGNQLGAAADSLGARTGQLLDELGGQTRSILGRGDPAAATSLSPQAATSGAPAASSWNTGAPAAVGASAAPPSAGVGGANWNPGATMPVSDAADAGAGWNLGATEAPATGVAPGQFPPTNQVLPTSQGVPTAPPLVNGNLPQASLPPANTAPSWPAAPVTAVNNDRWSNSVDQRFRTAATPPSGSTAGDAATPFTGAGPILPPPPNDPHAGAHSTPPAAAGSNTAGAANPAGGSEREIRGGMLGLPANRQLDDAAATAAVSPTAFPGTGPASPSPSLTAPITPALPVSQPTNTGGGLVSSYPNWNATTNAASPPTSPAATAEAAASNARDKAAVVLAWVLLFASIAGNMYLFWSYLDVRTKYRSLVRKTARAVGSRFSAA